MTHHTTFPLVALPLILVAARHTRIDGTTHTSTATTPAKLDQLTSWQLTQYCARCERLKLTDHDDYTTARALLASRAAAHQEA